MKTAHEKTHALAERIARRLGITLDFDDAWTLRRAERTLHRWHEGECGDSNGYASWCIVRDETTGKTYREVYPNTGAMRRTLILDREKGALKRVADVCARYGLTYYVQTDPRGGALYVARPADGMTGSNYSSVGVCVA